MGVVLSCRAVLFLPNFERMLWLEFPGCREICCVSETRRLLPLGHRLKDGGCKHRQWRNVGPFTDTGDRPVY